MVGTKVKHSVFGSGIITEFDGSYITVEFATKTSKFIYPDAFEKFIKAEDETVQKTILENIQAAKDLAEKKRLEEEAAQKAAEERKAVEEAAKRAQIAKKYSYSPKQAVRSQRIEGKRMIFFVFQGNTFNREYQGGYLWAPIANNTSTPPHHWTRLLDVRKGDIILHGCNGCIQAISLAKDSCYECLQPKELVVENLWDLKGRKVDCDYTYIENPIKTSNYVSDILRLRQAKYAPFDKFGSGNMGYLFEINRELARIFVKETLKKNPYLSSVDYINDFVSEEDDD